MVFDGVGFGFAYNNAAFVNLGMCTVAIVGAGVIFACVVVRLKLAIACAADFALSLFGAVGGAAGVVDA